MKKPLQDMVNTRMRPTGRVVSFASDQPRVSVPKRSRYLLWSVAVFSIAFLLLALSFLFGSARVDVFPKIQVVELNENLSASKSQENGGLLFDLVVISGEESKALTATEKKEVAEKASGTAVIFNSYNSTSQRLDVDTRLSGSNGKLYKTKTATTVPGMKTNGTPGSVEVPIYAVEAGVEYNSGPLDFQIVGFKGTPKYDKFKVRTKTDTEITGGFRGETLVLSETEKQSAADELKAKLEAELFKKATGQLPDGFILWPEAAIFTVDRIDQPLGTEKLTLTVAGTLYGLLFDKSEITKKIAEKKLVDYDGSDIYIENIHNLKFTLAPTGGDMTLKDLPTVSFNLSGSAEVVWRLDAEKFATDLAGQSKKDFISILSQYQNIDRAELSLRPVWQRTLPEEVEKIEVKVNYPEEPSDNP